MPYLLGLWSKARRAEETRAMPECIDVAPVQLHVSASASLTDHKVKSLEPGTSAYFGRDSQATALRDALLAPPLDAAFEAALQLGLAFGPVLAVLVAISVGCPAAGRARSLCARAGARPQGYQ